MIQALLYTVVVVVVAAGLVVLVEWDERRQIARHREGRR
jgi:hypothetical protein